MSTLKLLITEYYHTDATCQMTILSEINTETSIGISVELYNMIIM